MTQEIKAEAVYNKQECIDAFMSRKDLNETEQDLRNRIVAKNNEVSRRGHDLNKARKSVEQMEREFNAAKGEVEGLINFALSCEIKHREQRKESNGVNGQEAGHGA